MSARPFQIGDKVRKRSNVVGPCAEVEKPIYTVNECKADSGFGTGWFVTARIEKCECCGRGAIELDHYDSGWFVAVP